MSKEMEFLQYLNETYELSLTGFSPVFGNLKFIDKTKYVRTVVKDFGNGVGRVVYSDSCNRLVAELVEPLIVGLKEASDLLGWTKQHLSTYISRGKFPEPSMRLASGPIWTVDQILSYKGSRAENDIL